MKQLICFDVDGTLLTKEMENEGQYVKGIIPTSLLIKLWKKDYGIAIVSPSPYLPNQFSGDNHWFKRNGSNDYRWENVDDAIKYYKTNRFNTIYVDDLESNRKQLEKLDVISYSPEQFVSIFTKEVNSN